MPKANQTVITIILWAIVCASCAMPPLNSPLNSPLSWFGQERMVFYSEGGTILVYEAGASPGTNLAQVSGTIVRVNRCLLIERQSGRYVLPMWTDKVRIVRSGSDDLVVADNGKIAGAIGHPINPFGAGYVNLAQLPESGRQYLDAQAPTCKGLYEEIVRIYLG